MFKALKDFLFGKPAEAPVSQSAPYKVPEPAATTPIPLVVDAQPKKKPAPTKQQPAKKTPAVKKPAPKPAVTRAPAKQPATKKEQVKKPATNKSK